MKFSFSIQKFEVDWFIVFRDKRIGLGRRNAVIARRSNRLSATTKSYLLDIEYHQYLIFRRLKAQCNTSVNSLSKRMAILSNLYKRYNETTREILSLSFAN